MAIYVMIPQRTSVGSVWNINTPPCVVVCSVYFLSQKLKNDYCIFLANLDFDPTIGIRGKVITPRFIIYHSRN